MFYDRLLPILLGTTTISIASNTRGDYYCIASTHLAINSNTIINANIIVTINNAINIRSRVPLASYLRAASITSSLRRNLREPA